jgi:hypothetical protein
MTTVGMFDANTTYTVTIADVTDTFGKPIEAPVVFSFTTGN